jgi:hypothetical protein
MSTVKKGMLTCARNWCKHQRPFTKRLNWKRERAWAKRAFRCAGIIAVVLFQGCDVLTPTEKAVPNKGCAAVIWADSVLKQGKAPDVTPSDQCLRCEGKGWYPHEDKGGRVTCKECDGTGKVTKTMAAKQFNPDALTLTEVIKLYVENETAISNLWQSMVDSTTMLDAVTEWLRRQPKSEPKSDDIPPAPGPNSDEVGGMRWLSHVEAEARSRSGDNWIIVYLTGEQCSQCVQMEKSVFPDYRIKEASKPFAFLKVVGDRERWGASRYPAMLLVGPGWKPQALAYPRATIEDVLLLWTQWLENRSSASGGDPGFQSR